LPALPNALADFLTSVETYLLDSACGFL